MKKILVDTYKIKDLHSGLGQFSLNFASELLRQIPKDLEVDLLIPDVEITALKDKKCGFVKANSFNRYFRSRNREYTIWHSLHQFPAHLPHRSVSHILSIHDLNFLIEKNEVKSLKYLKRLQRNVNIADHITTISNYSKKQIEKNIDLNGKEVKVIYNGVLSDQEASSTKPDFIKRDKFFYSIGAFNKRKNFHSLIPVMKHFEDHQLILAGNTNTSYGTEVNDLIKKHGLQQRVILTGKIENGVRSWLYANCRAFLFPSIAEGFGLPVIEAMNYGKPVFLSKHTSLPEIGGDLAFYFDNFEEGDMSQLISDNLEVVSEDPERFSSKTKNYARKFNWENCIRQYLEIYQTIEPN